MPRVLIVGDRPAAMVAVRDVLRGCGCRVESVVSIDTAVSTLRSAWFSLVLCQGSWPIDGDRPLLRTLCSNDRGIPVIVLGEHASVQTAVDVIKMGAVDFLDMPCDTQHLRDKLSPWLASGDRVQARVITSVRIVSQRYRDSRVTLRSVARSVGVSTAYLCRLLKDQTHQTFLGHLYTLRVREAERLLADTDLIIKQIAAMSGFDTTARMDRWFRRLRGYSPMDFRRRLQERAYSTTSAVGRAVRAGNVS